MTELIDQLISFFMQYRVITTIIIVIFFVFINRWLSKLVIYLLSKLINKTNNQFFIAVLDAYEKPLRTFFIFLPIYIGIMSFDLTLSTELLIDRIFNTIIILIIGSGLIKLSSKSSRLFEKLKEKFAMEFDEILIPFFSKVLQVVIIAVILSLVAQAWGHNINNLVAGLGIGGLAVALAAQSTLGNLFGGVVIITEKPFSLGNWIKTPSVEGIVEDIGFRSTKIRTFANSVIVIPNSTLANQEIENFSSMGKRRIMFNLGLTYQTSRDQMKKCVERIEEMIRNHEAVHPETIMVRFDKFNDSSLDIFLYFFTKTTVWAEYLKVKEDINFKILEILEEEGASIAFPSRSLYVETVEKENENKELTVEG
ncbi:mechanosensitive ion channel family protein [Alkalihalobacillus sp. BA299]|uniref:mechanosensitive ion channel family protein n=1 Tax=Alkalihalobacillus sp. BA299 TaxID=2815938 RepID=UPI001FFE2B35|nr:mechanosensitive ion channel family protein [Alkalihalobacillus sp. BA299]